jgi:hypothetical protein
MRTRRIESFLLRLVVEDQNSAETDAWRGRIQHVGSGYERQFEHLQDIIAFIREQFPNNYVLHGNDEGSVSEVS